MNTFNNRGVTSRREFFRKTAVSAALVSATGSLDNLEAFAAPRPQGGTETRQYSKWIRPFSYQNWQGHYRQAASHISEFPDLHIEYGTPSVAVRIGPDHPEIHDFNQAMIFMGTEYRDNIPIMLWERKGAWHYGAQNQDDAGGYITFIRGGELIGFQMMYESINKGPYRFGNPYKPHAHLYDESLKIQQDASVIT